MEASPQIDQNLYSRQIGAYGVETMGKLMSLKVFVYGLRGVKLDYIIFCIYLQLLDRYRNCKESYSCWS